MAPHELLPEDVLILADGFQVAVPDKNGPGKHFLGGVSDSTDYSVTFDYRDAATPMSTDSEAPYQIAEHILWAPRKIRVACIGAGASGIMLCYKKEKEFGDDIDLVVYDRYPECGGVWYANRYPGCRCDVPSASYQFSFAPNPDWPRFYSDASDIQKYYQGYATKQGYVEKYIKLQHEVKMARWVEERGVWIISVIQTLPSGETRDFEDEAEFLVGNIGILNTWKWPDVPNRELFEGEITHSANYNTSLDLKGKRVAVIGSGASSLQIVPIVQKLAAEMIVFYRTPQWIVNGMPVEGYTDDRGRNFTYTEEQRTLFKKDPKVYLELRKKIENNINRSFRFNLAGHPFQTAAHKIGLEHMQDKLNHNPDLMKKLIPDFAMGCRRIGPGEGFLEALQAPNATLAEGSITTFTENGIMTSTGQEHHADIIICATGFDVSFKPYFPIIGVSGKSLAEAWASDPEAYLALAACGFPNFMLGSLGPNCPAGHGSFITVLESACNYIIKVIRKVQTENILSIEPKLSAVREYNEHTHEWLKRTVWATGCRSWYNQGKPGGRLTAQYPGSMVHWREMMMEPRFEDYEIRYRSKNRFQFMGNGFTRAEVDGEDLAWYLEEEHVNSKILAH